MPTNNVRNVFSPSQAELVSHLMVSKEGGMSKKKVGSTELKLEEDGDDKSELKIPFDSKALNGLRGFAALHLLIHHSFWVTDYAFILYGQVKSELLAFM